MTSEGSTPPSQDEFSAKTQLEFVLAWIQSQLKPKAQEMPLKEKFEEETNSDYDTEDDRDSETCMTRDRVSQRPFKVEAKIDIPTFDGTIDVEKLDSWIDQLETYFTLYGFSSTEKVAFARLKLTSHALAWWNSHLKTMTEEDVKWNQFTRLLREEYYLMGYSQEWWSRWHNL